MSIRILVADDHRLMREGLASLLAEDGEFSLVGEATTGREAVELTEELKPDVIVMDIAMPDLNGMDATRLIRSRSPTTSVVALSMHTEHRIVVDMMKAGARGYLPKSCAFEDLGTAIRCVCSGKTFLSAAIAGPVVQSLLAHLEADDQGVASPLSLREREVLQLVAEGQSSKQVAANLHVSINTVIRHRQHIMDKLGIHSVAELTRYAIREGICSAE